MRSAPAAAGAAPRDFHIAIATSASTLNHRRTTSPKSLRGFPAPRGRSAGERRTGFASFLQRDWPAALGGGQWLRSGRAARPIWLPAPGDGWRNGVRSHGENSGRRGERERIYRDWEREPREPLTRDRSLGLLATPGGWRVEGWINWGS